MEVPPNLRQFKFRIGVKEYNDPAAALIAFIVKRKVVDVQPPGLDTVLKDTLEKMRNTPVPAIPNPVPGTPPNSDGRFEAEYLLTNNPDYGNAVKNAYNEVVRETDGTKGQGTQVGNSTHSKDELSGRIDMDKMKNSAQNNAPRAGPEKEKKTGTK